MLKTDNDFNAERIAQRASLIVNGVAFMYVDGEAEVQLLAVNLDRLDERAVFIVREDAFVLAVSTFHDRERLARYVESNTKLLLEEMP